MNAGRQRLTPPGFLRRRVEDAEMLGMLTHERTAKLEWILAGRARHFIHEAFHIDGVLICIDAAPRSDRHMRVAHGVFDEQVRNGVAELRISGRLVISLQLTQVLVADNASRVQGCVDRLPGDPNVQTSEIPIRSAPASSIRFAPSCWSAALRCARGYASCASNCPAYLPNAQTSCRHACCTSSRDWLTIGTGSMSASKSCPARSEGWPVGTRHATGFGRAASLSPHVGSQCISRVGALLSDWRTAMPSAAAIPATGSSSAWAYRVQDHPTEF